MKVEKEKDNKDNAFSRFQSLAKRLLSVPKAEADKMKAKSKLHPKPSAK